MYKADVIHRRGPWNTKASVDLVTLEWVSWFNHHLLLAPIRFIALAEAEDNYDRQQTKRSLSRSNLNQSALYGRHPVCQLEFVL